ncbi:hypothetical protein GCM10022243_61960 [Saccharothrix violaceirubra]|uniref:Uncharacterized protein n=1 Tax=Saccharothrix violaceirubra TaxID=413306 RepID=A0A7W7T8Z2_9PSEU|nr:hypothetical protein [Saccharothrix violaceirubra]MBB4968172.1 hypothetical protein [Saccharothrix violaceirubra]
MGTSEWGEVPVGRDAQRWVTRRGLHDVLVVGHTAASCEHLFDALALIESDRRIQIAFTRAPDVFGGGVEELFRAAGGVVLPWEQAIREPFRLALAAAYGSVHRVHAPLVLMPHGAGYAKGFPTATGGTQVYGLDRQRLVRDGEPVARLVALSHDDQLDVLRDQCPEAVDVAEVVGDLSYDRLVASEPFRDAYRAALGVDDRELVVLASTWGSGSLFGMHFDLIPRLLDELPPSRFRVATLVHPAVWFGHGPRQVRAWLSDCVEAGLLLLAPDVDWRAAIVAADHVIGDHGSTTAYAAALGRTVLRVEPPARLSIVENSPQARLGAVARRLRSDVPVVDQLRDAAADPGFGAEIRAALTSRPGLATVTLRRSLYGILGLAEPGAHRAPAPVPVPPRWYRS